MNAKSITHLTATGPYAGQPFCPVNKAEALARGEIFMHIPYSHLTEFFQRTDLCPACRAEWDAAGEDETL